MAEQNPTEEEMIQQIYDYAAKLLVEQGKSREVVIQALEKEGLDGGYQAIANFVRMLRYL